MRLSVSSISYLLLSVFSVFFSIGFVASPCYAATYTYGANHTLVGTIQSTIAKGEDTLIKIAQDFELGYEEIVQANPDLDVWVPGQGNLVILPKQFILPEWEQSGKRMYINLAEMRLYHYKSSTAVITYPISIGRDEWRTPISGAKVVEKIVDPAWYPPETVRQEHAADGTPLPLVVPPGAENNPLGKYAIQLNLPGYFIHGTNRPEGIGMRVTHGCIRLRPDGIAHLFAEVERGDQVTIQFLPHKVTLHNKVIYFEAHQGGYGVAGKDYLADSLIQVARLAKEHYITVDWERMVRVAKRGRGIPTPLNVGSKVQIAPPLLKGKEKLNTSHRQNYLF